MPGTSGLELIQRVKAIAPATLTILITAYGSGEVEQAAHRLNVRHYMAKPFPLVELKRVVQDALTLQGDDGNSPIPSIEHIPDIQHGKSPVHLTVWDLSGQERFAFTRRAFFRGSKAVGLVYAVSARESFERLLRWHAEIREFLPTAPLVLVGNKIDLERQVTWAEGQSLAQAWGVPFFETSCVSGQGVGEFFGVLTQVAVNHCGSRTSKETASKVKDEEFLKCL